MCIRDRRGVVNGDVCILLKLLIPKMGVLNKAFFKIGYFSATNPVAAIGGALFFTVVFGMGCINLRLTVRKAC
jgi:hypothetical protein